MYAIISTGGKQYKISEGEDLRIEKLAGEPGAVFNFDNVLMVNGGADIKIGTPLVEGAKVEAEILSHGRGKKIIVYKSKKRKGYRRTQGHRQDYTEVKIKKIIF
ncbi:MAG: 50S ribosomal protein L21 [Pseudomonadota bacterium]